MSLVYCLFASRTECEYLGVLPIIAYSGRLHSTIYPHKYSKYICILVEYL